METIIKFLQQILLRLTLSAPKAANWIGGILAAIAAFTTQFGDLSGQLVWKSFTLQHVIILISAIGALLTRFAVAHPSKLNTLIAVLDAPVVITPPAPPIPPPLNAA